LQAAQHLGPDSYLRTSFSLDASLCFADYSRSLMKVIPPIRVSQIVPECSRSPPILEVIPKVHVLNHLFRTSSLARAALFLFLPFKEKGYFRLANLPSPPACFLLQDTGFFSARFRLANFSPCDSQRPLYFPPGRQNLSDLCSWVGRRPLFFCPRMTADFFIPRRVEHLFFIEETLFSTQEDPFPFQLLSFPTEPVYLPLRTRRADYTPLLGTPSSQREAPLAFFPLDVGKGIKTLFSNLVFTPYLFILRVY